jgi:hypothetical protein
MLENLNHELNVINTSGFMSSESSGGMILMKQTVAEF